VSGEEVIAATQNGTGILSYLAWAAWTGDPDGSAIGTARSLGDYLVDEALTPDEGVYPRVPRSTGLPATFPQPPDCGRYSDRPYEIQPDKAGLAAYALLELAAATGESRYRDVAVQTARVLASTMGDGDESTSPWPFRADFRTGEPRGEVSANSSFILRLFDGLIAQGFAEFTEPRARFWSWIENYQIPSIRDEGQLWVGFYENQFLPVNRNAWSPLHLANYLMDGQDAVSPRWREHTETLLAFVRSEFEIRYEGYVVCIEQDIDRKPFGGVLSAYMAAMARYADLTGSVYARGRAYASLSLLTYAVDDDGCPNDLPLEQARGGWQQDAHTDKLFNIMATLERFPEWAE